MKVLLTLNAFYFFYTLFLGLYMLRLRFIAVKKKQIDPRYFKTYQGEIPKELKVLENHFNNQFQIPLLFMLTSLFAIQSQTIGAAVQSFASLFVLTRIVHSYIHLTSNKVIYRAISYFSGVICLGIIWILILLNTFQ